MTDTTNPSTDSYPWTAQFRCRNCSAQCNDPALVDETGESCPNARLHSWAARPVAGAGTAPTGCVAEPQVFPTAQVKHLAITVDPAIPVIAFDHAGAQIHLGPPLDADTVVIAAESTADLVQFLARSILAVLAVDHTAFPAPTPPALLTEARGIVVDDLLRSLGVPADGPEREINEVAVSDVRTARRMAELVRQHLDTAIDEHPTLASLLATQAGL